MTTKIVDAIAQILENLNKDISIEEVNEIIGNTKEFDEQTLSAAFSLVYDKVLSSKLKKNKNNKRIKTFRVLTSEEIDNLGIENYNYILHLHNIGILKTIDFELFLEQLLLFPNNSITKEDINWSILVSLIEFNAELLPGSRVLLHSSDKIN